jgi:hypothetical protein
MKSSLGMTAFTAVQALRLAREVLRQRGTPPNKGMKLTSVERIGRSLISGVRRTDDANLPIEPFALDPLAPVPVLPCGHALKPTVLPFSAGD